MKSSLLLFFWFVLCAGIGCAHRKTVREYATLAESIPSGTARSQIPLMFRETVVQHPYVGTTNPLAGVQRVEHSYLELCERVAAADAVFVRVYPEGLLREVRAGLRQRQTFYWEGFGYPRESATGSGHIDVFYDANLKYMGYIAVSGYRR